MPTYFTMGCFRAQAVPLRNSGQRSDEKVYMLGEGCDFRLCIASSLTNRDVRD